MVTFDSTDLDNAVSESGVSHESVSNTDHDNASRLQQGYDFENFSEISPDPIHCWPLQEDGGSTAYDIVGSKDGTINGATPNQQGILAGSSYDFNNQNADYVQLPSLTSFSGLTILFWVYYEGIGEKGWSSEWNTALGTWADNNGHQFTMESESEGSSNILLKTPNGTALIQDMSTKTKEWVLFGGTLDGSTVRSYFNANQVDSVSVSSVDLSGGMRLGGRGISGTQLNGHISHVYLFNQALTQTQIQTLYQVVTTAGTLTTPYKSV